MKVAITGISGHLGNVIARKLLKKEVKIKGLYNSDKRAVEGLDVQLIQGDLLDSSILMTLFEGCDVIVHCAGKISIHGDKDGSVKSTNIGGVKNVLACAIKSGVKKIIHISSTHAVQEYPLETMMTENRPYKTESDFAYDHSKAVGEQLMLKAFSSGDVDGCVVRPSGIIGPFDYKPSEMGKALLDFKKGKVPLLPPGGYNFIDVNDVAEAVITAMSRGINGEIYFLTNQYYTIKQLAAKVGEITGKKVPQRVLPFWLMKAILPLVKFYGFITRSAPVFTIESISALKNGHPNIDNHKAVATLNLKTTPIHDTLTAFFEWHDSNTQKG